MFKPKTVCGDIFQIPIPLGSIKCIEESECPLYFNSSKISMLFKDDRISSWSQLVQKIIQTRTDMSGMIQTIHTIPDIYESNINIEKEIQNIDNAIGPTLMYTSYIRSLEFFLARNIPVVRTKQFPNGLFFQAYWTSPIKEKVNSQTGHPWIAYTTQSLQSEISMCFLTLSLLYHTLGILKIRSGNDELINESLSHYYSSMMFSNVALNQYKHRTRVKMFNMDRYEPVNNLMMGEHQLLVFIETVYRLCHISIILANIKFLRIQSINDNFPENDPFRWIRRDIKQFGEYVSITEGGYNAFLIYQKLHFSLSVQIMNLLTFLKTHSIFRLYNVIELTNKAVTSMVIYAFIEFIKNMNFVVYDEQKPDVCYIVYTKYEDVQQQDITIPFNIVEKFLPHMLNFIMYLSMSFCSKREIIDVNKRVKDILFVASQTIQPMLKVNKYEILSDDLICPSSQTENIDNEKNNSPDDSQSYKFDIPINITSLENIIRQKFEKMFDFINNNESINDYIHLLLYNCLPS